MKSVILAEAEAILYGLSPASALGYPNIVVESNDMSIIHFIARNIEFPNGLSTILNDISSLIC